jgi:hypothetical protein
VPVAFLSCSRSSIRDELSRCIAMPLHAQMQLQHTGCVQRGLAMSGDALHQLCNCPCMAEQIEQIPRLLREALRGHHDHDRQEAWTRVVPSVIRWIAHSQSTRTPRSTDYPHGHASIAIIMDASCFISVLFRASAGQLRHLPYLCHERSGRSRIL